MEQCVDISIKMINPEAKMPTIHKDNNRISVLYAAEDVFIAPNETVAVSTGLGFIFPDDVGLMFFPPSELSSKASLRFANNVFVLENDYYYQGEVKIHLQNNYSLNKDSKKVPEYKLIDGTIVSDSNNLYEKGTVKICKGDCIAQMMPVDAAYNGVKKPTEKPTNKDPAL